MKKLVLTAVVVGFAAVAAQAQGTGDGGVTREAFRLFYESQHKANAQEAQAARKADSLARAAAKRAEQERVRNAREQKANKPVRHFTHVPATGVMRDYAVEGRVQEQNAAHPAPQAENKPATQNNSKAKNQSAVKWIARVMGFEKYANETDEEWQARLYAMTMK